MCFRALVDLASFYDDNEEISLPDGALCGINMEGVKIKNINFNRTYLVKMKFSTSIFQNSTVRVDCIFECHFYAANLSGLHLIPREGLKLHYIDENTIPPAGYRTAIIEGCREDSFAIPGEVYLEAEASSG